MPLLGLRPVGSVCPSAAKDCRAACHGLSTQAARDDPLGFQVVARKSTSRVEETLGHANLSSKLSAGALSQADSDAIGEALEIPERVSKGNIAVTYRNRLAHHIRPSVDYCSVVVEGRLLREDLSSHSCE